MSPNGTFGGVCKISRDALIRSCCTTRFIRKADAESKPGLLLSRLITAEGGFVDFSILHYDKEIVGRVFDQLDNRFRNRANKNPGKRL